MRATDKPAKLAWLLAAVLLLPGLAWGLLLTPPDQVQGATVKIMFIHVPSALIAINAWLMMLVASLIWLVRRHHVSALAAKAAAPVGISMTAVTILTGAIWGKPMWGTWWAWEPRLTSFLILFLCYVGYITLWRTVEDRNRAADLAACLCIVGSIFALLSRYSVMFWSQGLHQGATLSVDRETHIHQAYYVPLTLCMAGFVVLFIAHVLEGTRTEVRKNQIARLLVRISVR